MTDNAVIQVRTKPGCITDFRQQVDFLCIGNGWLVGFDHLYLLVQFGRILLRINAVQESRQEKQQKEE